MLISHMLILMTALLTAGGAAQRTLAKAGGDRLHGLFFLLCVFTLSFFSVTPSDDISISPACVLAAAWLFGNCFSGNERIGISAAVLPAAAAVGALIFPLALMRAEPVCYAAGIAILPLVPIFGVKRALALAAAAPVFAFAFGYLFRLFTAGYGSLDVGESCLAFQLTGMLAASVFAEATDFWTIGRKRKTSEEANIKTLG